MAPNASLLERHPAAYVWDLAVAPQLDAYLGLELEVIAAQAYDRFAPRMALPPVKRWGRWEGTDRQRHSLEIDIVSELVDGRWMTGAVKWDRAPIDSSVHRAHLSMLQRAADAGRAWAHAALDAEAPLLYVAAGGFSAEFRRVARKDSRHVILWTLEDLYGSA